MVAKCSAKILIIILFFSFYLKSQYVPCFNLDDYGSVVMSIVIDKDTIITGSRDGCVREYNKYNGKFLRMFAKHDCSVTAIAVHDDILVVADHTTNVRVYNKSTGKLLHLLQGHECYVGCVAIDKDFIVTGSEDKTARIYATQTGEFIETLTGHTYRINSVAIDNEVIVINSLDQTTRIYDKKTREFLGKIVSSLGSAVVLDQNIIIKPHFEDVLIYDKTTQELLSCMTGFDIFAYSVAANDNIIIVGGSGHKRILLFDRMTSKCTQTLHTLDEQITMAIDKDTIVISSVEYVGTNRYDTIYTRWVQVYRLV